MTTQSPPRSSRARASVLVALACAIGSIGVAACARHTPPHATAIDAERAHVSVAELDHGRSLLVAKCGSRCHKTPLPGDKRMAEWPKALDEMAERANLEPSERHSIEQYLLAMAPR